jgi:hypothetical protein
MNPASKSHGDVDSDLPRRVQTFVITKADHLGISGRTVQNHPLHFDPEDDEVVA